MESPGWLYCGGNARIFDNSEHENSEATGAVGKYGFVMDNLDEELIEVGEKIASLLEEAGLDYPDLLLSENLLLKANINSIVLYICIY